MVQGEATIKRLYRRGAPVAWRPVNARMAPLEVEAQDVEIKGVVTGLIRLYEARGRSAQDDATVPRRTARLGSPGQSRPEGPKNRPATRGHWTRSVSDA
jgi:hypothetical protein